MSAQTEIAPALAHEPRGARTPGKSAPRPREPALRGRERDTSRLHHLGTLAVRSAVRVSLCERDEHKSDSNGRTCGDSAPHDHAHNPMRITSPPIRPSESHTSCATAFSSGVPSLIPASRAQIVDDTYFFRARSAWRTYSHDMLDQIEVLDRTHARAEPPPRAPSHPRPCTSSSTARPRASNPVPLGTAQPPSSVGAIHSYDSA